MSFFTTRKFYVIAVLVQLFPSLIIAQTADTVTIQTYTWEAQNNPNTAYDSPGRRWFQFPADDGQQYQKILMLYNLKCFSDGTAGNLGFPCGEWDYLTYTYLYQHTGVLDSNLATYPQYLVNNADFDELQLSPQAHYVVYQTEENLAVIDSIQNETTHTIGSGIPPLAFVMNASVANGTFRFSAEELLAAGMTAGMSMGQFEFYNSSADVLVDEMTLETSWNIGVVSPDDIAAGNWQNVFSGDYTFMGNNWNSIIFQNSLTWDGVSDLWIRFHGYTDTPLSLLSDEDTTSSSWQHSADDRFIRFDWQDLVSVPASTFENCDSSITISLWQRGDANFQPENGTLFEGVNSSNQRVLNVHLPWSNSNVYWDAGYDGGYDRINATANATQFEGAWNHWAFVKDVASAQMRIYLNGALWHSGSNLNNTMTDVMKFYLGGAAGWTNYYRGDVDEFAVFSEALPANIIEEYMHSAINASHPNYEQLEVYYTFDEEDGELVTDHSGNARDGWVFGNPARLWHEGAPLITADAMATRPVIKITSGDFFVSSETVIDNDTVFAAPYSVVEYTDSNYWVQPVSSELAWPVVDNILITPNGDTSIISAPSNVYTLTNQDIEYYQRPYEVVNRFELNRFITMYGIQLTLGPEGWTWVVDVTDFEPLLHDSVELEAGNWQELLDLKFQFITGTPAREVKRVERIWDRDLALSNFDNVVVPKTLGKNPGEAGWKMLATTTGHQFDNPFNCAEFCNNMHSVEVNGQEQWSWEIMQECADNPLYPQGGTWIFDRAGWCPGMNSTTREFELTPFVSAQDSFVVDYDITYNDYGNYVFFGTLIGYGEPNHAHDAEIDLITAPSNWKIHSRWNPICEEARFVLRNKGSQPLTSATILYHVENGPVDTLQWTGDLDFMQREEVVLPYHHPDFWSGDDNTLKAFHIEVLTENGADENATNNAAVSYFYPPVTYQYSDLSENRLIIQIRTNNLPSESSYALYNASNEVVYARDDFNQANTTYRDTVALDAGCYRFHLMDSDDDGLSFFANSDGDGTCRLDRIQGADFEFFEQDFGKEIQHSFVWNTTTVSVSEHSQAAQVYLFPNPCRDFMNVSLQGFKGNVSCEIFNAHGLLAASSQLTKVSERSPTSINTSQLSQGVYFIQFTDAEKTSVQRFVKR
jgi:hypothetical protein